MGSESIIKKRVLKSIIHNLIIDSESIIKKRVLGFIIDNQKRVLESRSNN